MKSLNNITNEWINMLSIMTKLINPEDELQLPNLGLPRMHRKYMPDISREINMTEAVTLNPGTLSNFHKDCLTCIGNSFTGLQFAVNKFIPSTSVKVKNTILLISFIYFTSKSS